MQYAIHRFKAIQTVRFETFKGISIVEDEYLDEFMSILFSKVVNTYDLKQVGKVASFLEQENFSGHDNEDGLRRIHEEQYEIWSEVLDEGIKSGKKWQDKKDKLDHLYAKALMVAI